MIFMEISKQEDFFKGFLIKVHVKIITLRHDQFVQKGIFKQIL